MRMMAQSARSVTVKETMRISVVSKRRTTFSSAPTRFSRKTLNWRTLGQSRPRDVANPVPAPSPTPEPIASPSEGAFSIAHHFDWGQFQPEREPIQGRRLGITFRRGSSLHQCGEWFAIFPGNAVWPADVVPDLQAGIDAEALVERGEKIAHGRRPVRNVGAVLAGRANHLAAFDPAAADNDGPAAGPMVAAGILIDARRPAEFAQPYEHGILP